MQTFQDTDLEQALVSLIRLIKASSYYPDAHPAVNKAVDESTQKLRKCASQSPNGAIALEIKRQGFLLDQKQFKPDNKILAQLAQRFFLHKIKNLIIFEDLREQHLLSLAHCLSMEPQHLDAKGGTAQVMERAQATSILLNQIDLSAIGSRQDKDHGERKLHASERSSQAVQKSNIRGDSAHSAEKDRAERNKFLTAMFQKAGGIIEHGEHNRLPEFKGCLDKIRPCLDSILATPPHRPDALNSIETLDRWIHTDSYPAPYREACTHCLRQLAPDKTVSVLLDAACHDSRERSLALRVIKLLNADCGNIVWEQLINEPNPKVRRFLASVMTSLGPDADHILLKHLEDSRWYVVRNALNILSSRRNPDYIHVFEEQLAHHDPRVTKEAIAALAAIRHEQATDALLEYLTTPNCPLPELAILALGAQQDARAIPALGRIALQRDRLLKQKKIRLKAIEALGEIRNSEANPSLSTIIKKGKIIRRSEYQELRLAAISALGKTAGEKERDLLRDLSNSNDAEIANTARQALQTGKKE